MIGAHQAAATYSDGLLSRSGFRGLSAFGQEPPAGIEYDVVSVNAAPVNATELANKIKNSNGYIVVPTNSPEAQIAKAHWLQFTMTPTANGQVEITQSDYTSWLLYGGIAIGAFVLIKNLNG